VLTELLGAQERGALSGIYGRLGDQGSIDAKYDIAISTASGQLEFIVVECLKNAEDCVKYLRQHNIGRASFIALDKMQEQRGARQRPF